MMNISLIVYSVFIFTVNTMFATEERTMDNIIQDEHFKWVDPLSLSIYGNFLLSVNRNNREFVVLRKEDGELLHSIFLGDAPNGPHDLVVVNNEAIISYRARNGLVFVALDSFA